MGMISGSEVTEYGPNEAFIQAPERRPKLAGRTEAQGVPLIDLSGASLPADELIREIGGACAKWGFFQVINHGVDERKRARAEAAAAEFFALAAEEKRKVRKCEERVMGYYETEHTKNVRDWKEVFDFTVEDPTFVPANTSFDSSSGTERVMELTNQWPLRPVGMRQIFEDYASEVQKLAKKLLELIALSLGLPANRFDDFFNDQTSFVRLNHYPTCPIPHLALGVARHKDAGALTILAQDDVGGLEVKRKADGEWVGVKPLPNAYIINVGDIIQVWSNERYESVEHRVVVNSEKERFSIPFFYHPSHYATVQPLEELVDDKNPGKYRPYNWGKFYVTKKFNSFKKLDLQNIQVHDFRVSH